MSFGEPGIATAVRNGSVVEELEALTKRLDHGQATFFDVYAAFARPYMAAVSGPGDSDAAIQRSMEHLLGAVVRAQRRDCNAAVTQMAERLKAQLFNGTLGPGFFSQIGNTK